MWNFDRNRHTIYEPVNKEKYKGKKFPVCRSSWERDFCKWADMNKSVLSWGSECLEIKYQHPYYRTPQGLPQLRRYYPDFYLVVKDKRGEIQKWVVEVKPYKETHPPRKTGKKSRNTILNESKTWKINNAKWKAAEIYCKKIGAKFKIITEKQLYQ